MKRANILTEAPLLPFTFCFILGLVLGGWCTLSWIWFAALVLVAVLLRRWPVAQTAMLDGCFLVLGMVLMGRAERSMGEPLGGEVTVEAVVASEAADKPKTLAFDLLLAHDGRKLLCYVAKDERAARLKPGDGLLVRLRPLAPDSGSQRFDRYLHTHGYCDRCYAGRYDWQPRQVSLSGLSVVQRSRLWFLRQRHGLLERYRQYGFDDEQYAVLAAMTLGDRSALSKELRDVYSTTGAYHVLALSGLHLGIIYMLLSFFTLGRRLRFLTQLLTIVALWAFAFLVGLSPSVVRSATMISVYALLSLSARQRMSVNALCFTAIVMLAFSPFSLFDVGFQMSYLAVFSILLWLPLLMGVFPAPLLQRHGWLRWVWGVAAVSIAAQLGVAPLIAYYFGRFSTYFLLTNFIVVPAATCILYGMLLVLLLPVAAPLLAWLVGALNGVLTAMAALPGAAIDGIHLTALQVAMVYVLTACTYLIITYSRASGGCR